MGLSWPPEDCKRSAIVVDDNEVSLAVAADELVKAGWCVLTRTSGVGTVAAVLRYTPTVLVVDQRMTSCHGDRIIDILRRTAQPVVTKLILHSALPLHELVLLAKRCGADGYACKGSGDLVSVIEKYTANSR